MIEKEKPDIILVHGDTTTTLVGALAGFYHQVKIGHVEAGLRTWDMTSPFPEEANRCMVDAITDFYFAPTEQSKQNLLKEGKDEKKIYVTGNSAIDALKTTISKNYKHEIFDWLGEDRLIFLTAHRRENWGEPMKNMFRAIKRVIEENEDVKVVYPVHLNPTVREAANEILGENQKIKLIEPLDVIDCHNFENRAYVILTDSGGIQEEAPSLGKPVLVLRDTTERPEGIKAGTLKLATTKEDNIYHLLTELLQNEEEYDKMSKASNPYGDGTTSQKIADIIIDEFENNE